MTPLLKVKLLHPGVAVPRYHSDGAAGIDLAAFFPDRGSYPLHFKPDASCRIPTGVAVEIPPGFEGQVRARSSFADKTIWHVGTIDGDYRGELFCCFRPLAHLSLCSGERIGQLIVSPVARCQIQVVSELTPSGRGSGGFGSTGKVA